MGTHRSETGEEELSSRDGMVIRPDRVHRVDLVIAQAARLVRRGLVA